MTTLNYRRLEILSLDEDSGYKFYSYRTYVLVLSPAIYHMMMLLDMAADTDGTARVPCVGYRNRYGEWVDYQLRIDMVREMEKTL